MMPSARPELPVRLRREVERRAASPTVAHDDVRALVRPDRHVGVRQVRHLEHAALEARLGLGDRLPRRPRCASPSAALRRDRRARAPPGPSGRRSPSTPPSRSARSVSTACMRLAPARGRPRAARRPRAAATPTLASSRLHARRARSRISRMSSMRRQPASVEGARTCSTRRRLGVEPRRRRRRSGRRGRAAARARGSAARRARPAPACARRPTRAACRRERRAGCAPRRTRASAPSSATRSISPARQR